ncbi:whirlin [Crotalus adamanteus]|uniref:Whirlin n=1 Tax=Crotalus adamanteus TaxID=8729 RepID=A0AAW1ATA9_CROAD
MIRGGSEYALGIYITGVDKDSEAENTGLKVGDQILEVNGRSFLSISHDEAVKLLKSSRHLIMTVKDVGRLPHARATVDETRWIASSRIGEPMVNSAGASGDPVGEMTPKTSFYKGLAGSQVTLNSLVNQSRVMLEEHARHLLNEPERSTMAYYLDEYKENNISVDSLILALFELLNTHAKFSLLSEVRGVISPQDLDHFDDLVLKREIEFMKARQPSGTGTDCYSTTSYSDSASCTESHFTSTTASSARSKAVIDRGEMKEGREEKRREKKRREEKRREEKRREEKREEKGRRRRRRRNQTLEWLGGIEGREGRGEEKRREEKRREEKRREEKREKRREEKRREEKRRREYGMEWNGRKGKRR